MANIGLTVMLEGYPDILEVDDFCKILRIGRNSAYKILDSRAIGAFKIGSSWKIPKFALMDFLNNPTDLIQ